METVSPLHYTYIHHSPHSGLGQQNKVVMRTQFHKFPDWGVKLRFFWILDKKLVRAMELEFWTVSKSRWLIVSFGFVHRRNYDAGRCFITGIHKEKVLRICITQQMLRATRHLQRRLYKPHQQCTDQRLRDVVEELSYGYYQASLALSYLS